MRKWGFVACYALLLFFFSAQAASSAQTQAIGGRWLADGAGFAEKNILRVALTADGYIDVISASENGVETISGYKVHSTLRATKMEFDAWSSTGTYQFSYPLTIPNYNPTLSNPLQLPTFKVNNLEYTISLTNATSGTLKIRGYANIDIFGECEVNADCAIWKEGSAKPDIPNTESGCSTLGIGGALLLPLLLLRKKQKTDAR